MRRYVRHATDVPVDVRLSQVIPHDREYLQNISRGGLCFTSTISLTPGQSILIEIPVAKPVFKTVGVVAWCRAAVKDGDGYDVGVSFANEDPGYRRQIVDQICQIENMREAVWLREGRRLTGEEAALAWIQHMTQEEGGSDKTFEI